MKIAFAYKWARLESDAMVRADGSVDWRGAKMNAGDDDPAALETAKELAAATGGSIVGLTIGDGDASWALARGVEETISVTDALPLADNAATAAIIAGAVKSIADVQLLVIGDSKENPGVAVAAGAQLGWTVAAGLLSAKFVEGKILGMRKTPEGLMQIEIDTPAVLAIEAEGDVDKAPGMKERLAARKRPVTKTTLAEIGAAGVDVTSIATRKPDKKAVKVFEGAQAVAQLVAALKDEGAL